MKTQNNYNWGNEYKKYRSTEDQIEQNREANRRQQERDDNAVSGGCSSQNTQTPQERAVPAGNRAS